MHHTDPHWVHHTDPHWVHHTDPHWVHHTSYTIPTGHTTYRTGSHWVHHTGSHWVHQTSCMAHTGCITLVHTGCIRHHTWFILGASHWFTIGVPHITRGSHWVHAAPHMTPRTSVWGAPCVVCCLCLGTRQKIQHQKLHTGGRNVANLFVSASQQPSNSTSKPNQVLNAERLCEADSGLD